MSVPFRPARWLAAARVQTLGASLPLWTPRTFALDPSEERLRIPLPGEGNALIARAWWAEDRRPCVILIHGVGGSTESNYVRRAAMALHHRGIHAVRLNLRGAGESLPEAPTLYHAGLGEDLERVVAFLSLNEHISGVGVIGFSLGGNVALGWAASARSAPWSLRRAVVSISAPLDLAATSRNLGTWAALPYRRYLMPSLVKQARDIAASRPLPRLFDPAPLAHLRTVWEYDDAVIAPMHGFGTAERYYAEASAGPKLARLDCPALVIHADDDPMVPVDSVRPFLSGAPVEVAIATRGGHVGFFASFQERDWVTTWAMARALDFLERHLVPA